MSLLTWLRKRVWGRQDSLNRATITERISFGGGTGETVEGAIFIRGARFDLEGTYAEFAWLTQRYGQKDSDWTFLSHAHGKYGSRDIDTMEIKLADGTPLTVYFDCTESFGKWPPSPTGSGGRLPQRGSEDTLP